jgi:hypothetical protein
MPHSRLAVGFSNSPRGGFAIGVVFLVLALIAAILTAISIMSNASQDTASAAEARSNANGVIQIGAGFANAINTKVSAGTRIEQLYLFRIPGDVSGAYDRAENLVGALGAMSFPQYNPAAYQQLGAIPCTQAVIEAEVAANTNNTTFSCVAYLTRVRTSNYGQGGSGYRDATYLIYTAPLTLSVARQVNSLLWAASASGDLPDPSTLTLKSPGDLNKLAAPTIAKQVTALVGMGYSGAYSGAPPAPVNVTTDLALIDGVVRPEGVYSLDQATAGAQTRNIYYKVVSSL